MILTSFPFSLWSTVWIISTPTLRISQQNVDAERIHMGDMLNAFVFSYDAVSDNRSPLLVLSMHPPNQKGNGTLQQHYCTTDKNDSYKNTVCDPVVIWTV